MRSAVVFASISIATGLVTAISACTGEDPDITSAPPSADASTSSDGSVSTDPDGGQTTDAGADVDAAPPMTGKARWLQEIIAPSSTSFVVVSGVAVDAQNQVYVTGLMTASGVIATIPFGNNKTVDANPANGTEGFVAKYDATGVCQWVIPISGAGDEEPYQLRAAPNGDVVLLGSTNSASVTIDSVVATRAATAGSRDFLIARISPLGKIVWHKIYGGPASDSPDALAVSAMGDVAVGGYVVRANGADNINFGPSAQISATPSPARFGFVVLLDGATGLGKWARPMPTVSTGVAGDESWVRSLAFDTKGNVIAGGNFNKTMLFHDNPAMSIMATADTDAWVAKLSGLNGTASWGKALVQTSGQDRVSAVTTNGADEIIAAGTYLEANAGAAVTIGGNNMPKFGGVDIFVAKLDPTGTVTYARGFGGTDLDNVGGASFDPWGNVVLAGRTNGTRDWGGKQSTGGGGNDGYLVKLLPDGASAHWAYGLGSAGNDDVFGLATSKASGVIAVTGVIAGPATIAGKDAAGPPAGGPASSAYILALDP